MFTAGKFYSVGDGKFVFRSLEVIGLVYCGFLLCVLVSLFVCY